MAKITLNGKAVSVEEGIVLSQLIGERAHLDTPCGGRGHCGKCRVQASGKLSPVSKSEKELLTAEDLQNGIRLACCCRVEGDCTVTTSDDRKTYVLGAEQKKTDSVNPFFTRYGAAVDIGTTTLAAVLYALDGRILAQSGKMNPQSKWGADVISRIDASLKGQGEELACSVQNGINNLLIEMCRDAGISVDAVDGMVITGNTAMLYLLTRSNPDCLSHAPFEMDRGFGEIVTGESLHLICQQAKVYLPRCLSSFVGADTNTALLSSRLLEQPESCIMADIGTNGEIALWNNGKLLCCSTAAGPAFEGAGLSMGMPGQDGAVDHVTVENGKLKAHVLGDTEPVGICGSGIIDALACLLETEDLDETGHLEDEEVAVCGKVTVSQKDIRTMQLAKSAICAGIQTLMDTARVKTEDIGELAIAGGFGSYLNAESAGRIGLIPGELAGKVRVLGNAALKGAAELLLNKDRISCSESIADMAETVDLSTNHSFMQAYTEGMFFDA